MVEGSTLEITTDYEHHGDATKIACSYQKLPQSVKVGGQILIADGTLVLTVKELKETSVICEVMNNCKLGEKKNMNLPGVSATILVLVFVKNLIYFFFLILDIKKNLDPKYIVQDPQRDILKILDLNFFVCKIVKKI